MTKSYRIALAYLSLPIHERIKIINKLKFPLINSEISNYEFDKQFFKWCADTKKVNDLIRVLNVK